MNEQQLRRNARDLIRLVRLQREIPQRELVVRRHAEHRRIVRRPLHRRDRRLQIVEAAHEASPISQLFASSTTSDCEYPTRGTSSRPIP